MIAPPLTLRDETPTDDAAITTLTEAAFAPRAISRHREHHVVRALRAAGALSLSLVAEQAGQPVGHLACSPVSVADGRAGWFGLGPVSVAPAHQGRGIGSALIRAALERLRARGARGGCLVGHPGYDGRFGFVHPPGMGIAGVPPEAFFALAFEGPWSSGQVRFHAAFDEA